MRGLVLIGLCLMVAAACSPRPPASPAVATRTVPRRPVVRPTSRSTPNAHGANVTVEVNDDGSYVLSDDDTGWTFTGTVGHAVGPRRAAAGRDRLGAYAGVAFDTADDVGPITAEVRTYTGRPVVLFRWTTPASRATPPAAFPSVTVPAELHTFSFGDTTFGQPDFHGHAGGTPWLLFDDAGRAVVLSPAANYLTADMRRTTDDGGTPGVASGLNAGLSDLPAGFSHQSIMAFGDRPSDAWSAWGHALTDLAGKKRPANDADVGLAKLGYWTNTGAAYYYNFDPARGYAGTIKDAVDAFRRRGIPLGYVELDSFWYQKTTTKADGTLGPAVKVEKYPPASWNCYGGITKYEASPDLFPDGLAAWQRTVGLPISVHARWVDVASPYRDRYRVTGVAATDAQYWLDRAAYLQQQGVVNYEQDWITEIYKQSPRLGTTTWAGDAFADGMANGMKAHGLSVQYCMAPPRFFLQGSKYDNLSTVRVANDRFDRPEWNRELYTSQMATALGEWPFVDNFRSTETANLTLAVLSAGMVGFGDAMNEADPVALSRAARADGVVVKPDTAAVPLDSMYVADAGGDAKVPMTAAAYTDHGALRTAYVFTFPRAGKKQDAIAFRPAELGLAGDCWVYEPLTGIGRRVAAGGAFTDAFVDYRQPWATYVVAPVCGGGVALVGDAGKIASMGRQRIASAEATPTGVRATVTFAAGERAVTLHGYADAAPALAAEGGFAGPVAFDSPTHRFTVDVSRNTGGASVSVVIRGVH